MKAIHIIQIAIALLAMPSCQGVLDAVSPEKETRAVSYISDITDTGLLQVDSSELLGFYGIADATLYKGYIFRSRVISESEEKKVMQLNIKPANYLTSDEQERIAVLKNFQSQISREVRRLEAEKITPRKHSMVYQAILKEAQCLAASSATSRTMVITSDLDENADGFSFYDKSDFALARDEPEQAANRIEQAGKLPSLKGIDVYIVHRPSDYKEQLRYQISSRVFQTLLSRRGANVFLVTNIVDNGS